MNGARLIMICVAVVFSTGACRSSVPTTAQKAKSLHSVLHVKIENGVAECLVINEAPPKMIDNVVVLPTQVRRQGLPNTCGCKSALLAYSVLETVPIGDEKVEYERALGRLAVDEEWRPFSFVLSSDSKISPQGRLILRISCAGPG